MNENVLDPDQIPDTDDRAFLSRKQLLEQVLNLVYFQALALQRCHDEQKLDVHINKIVELAEEGLKLLAKDTLPPYVCSNCHGSGRVLVQGREER